MITVEVQGLEKALADIRKYSEGAAKRVEQELNTTAQLVRGDAIRNAPVNKRVGLGGQLRRLITADPVRNLETFVRSRAKYSEFVEFGTGIYGENPNGGHRRTPWVYYDEGLKRFVWTRGFRARPFMHPAAESNRAGHIRRMTAALKP